MLEVVNEIRVPTPGGIHGAIPLVDLGLQHSLVANEVEARIREVCRTGGFILGPEVDQFEDEFARYCGVGHCVGVANGTEAIELALRAVGVGPGDEVIIPANTFIATAEAVVRSGADIRLADVTEDYLIDPDSAAAAVTHRTRAAIAVHLYGQIAPMAALRDRLPDDVLLIEDAAQAHGARQDGRSAGSVGVVAGTSFYPARTWEPTATPEPC